MDKGTKSKNRWERGGGSGEGGWSGKESWWAEGNGKYGRRESVSKGSKEGIDGEKWSGRVGGWVGGWVRRTGSRVVKGREEWSEITQGMTEGGWGRLGSGGRMDGGNKEGRDYKSDGGSNEGAGRWIKRIRDAVAGGIFGGRKCNVFCGWNDSRYSSIDKNILD